MNRRKNGKKYPRRATLTTSYDLSLPWTCSRSADSQRPSSICSVSHPLRKRDQANHRPGTSGGLPTSCEHSLQRTFKTFITSRECRSVVQSTAESEVTESRRPLMQCILLLMIVNSTRKPVYFISAVKRKRLDHQRLLIRMLNNQPQRGGSVYSVRIVAGSQPGPKSGLQQCCCV